MTKYVSHDPESQYYNDVVLGYWDLVQVRYHMLRALKLLQGEAFTHPGMTPQQHAIEELEAGHRLANHLMAEIEHVKEEK